MTTLESAGIAKVAGGNHFFLHFNVAFLGKGLKSLIRLTRFRNPLLLSLLHRGTKLYVDCTFPAYPKRHQQLILSAVCNLTTFTYAGIMHILMRGKLE